MRRYPVVSALLVSVFALTLTAPCQEKTEKPTVGWTMDPTEAKIPNSPVSGKVHGKNFQIAFTLHEKGGLVFRIAQGKKLPEETIDFNLFRTPKAKESLAGWTFVTSPKKNDSGKDPGIVITSVQPGMDMPKMELLIPGEYALKLEFGKVKDGIIAGKIYFATKDKMTYVAGIFELKEE